MYLLGMFFKIIMSCWPSILVIVIAAFALTYAYVKLGKKEWVYRKLFMLVTYAEKEWGSGAGKVKYNYVVDQFYSIMPKILKMFITRKLLDGYIDSVLDELREVLEEGITLEGNYLDSYKPRIE